jgi:hypothetical protein
MAELSYPAGAAAAGSRLELRGAAAPFALGALAVLGLGGANGGYFPSSWGWASVALATVLLWALALGGLSRPTGLEGAFLGALLLVACWYGVSGLWGVASSSSDELARVLLYVCGGAAALAVVRRNARPLLAGVLAGSAAIAGYALATRLFPTQLGNFDPISGYRLATPIGYWNALGLLCALALLLALALAAGARSPLAAALAAAPAPVLAATLYFTFGRGAWISLGAGLAFALALDPRRLRLTASALTLGLPASVGVLLGSRSRALTHLQASAGQAAHDGHRLALVVAALVVLAAALAAGLTLIRHRVALPARAHRTYAIVLALAALAALAGGLIRLGGPVSAVHRAWSSFAAPPPKIGTNLQGRLFSFSGSGRADLYRAAWRDFEAHPLLGSGAGSFEAYWLQHRPDGQKVRDAHSLYLETLAELGVVGLVLLVVALAAPLVAAVRARRRAAVPAAAGAYLAYLLGAGADWDWELAAVTLAALLVGVALLGSARPDEPREAGRRLRYGMLAAALALGGFGFVFLVGNLFLARAADAARAGRWTTAAADARKASSWLFWSTRPWQQLGEAQLGLGQTRAAQRSFRSALRKDAGDWSLWLDLARASTGRAQAAALAHAKRLDPLAPEIATFEHELGSSSGIDVSVGQG